MIKVKCIQKFRDKQGKIYGYRLQYLSGQTQDVKPENLKQAIKNNQIQVTNLKLTSNNRLIDAKDEVKLPNEKLLGTAPQKSKKVIIKEKLIEKAKYISNNYSTSPSIRFDGFDVLDMKTTSISEEEALTRETSVIYWMHIGTRSIEFEIQVIHKDDAEDKAAEFKHYKKIKLDVLNTPNAKLAELEDKYKQEIEKIYMS